MRQKAEGAPVPQWNVNQGVDDFQNPQQFGKPGNVPLFPQFDGAGTSSQSVVSPPNNFHMVTPPSMTAPPAHDHTMNHNWITNGTWTMSQMDVHSPPQQNMMHGAEQGYSGNIPNYFPQRTNINEAGTSSQQGSDDFQNFAQFENPENMPQRNHDADSNFLQGRSSGVDFDFRF